jgi:predicted ribosomally synthesized six-cysteine peptide SCIFF
MNGGITMKHIRTINKTNIKDSLKKPGCKECANSCQSACKTSCTVANLACEN